jgi:formylglycine-generating enzyme required for sulfatase activity/tetratricopeptide (TPR) repeat protein
LQFIDKYARINANAVFVRLSVGIMNEIINPYIAGAPVTEQRMFFGREDIFQWIENSIAGQYADHILVVHGQRRVGKTSVLKQLGNRLPKRFIPVFFDLQGRTHTTLDHFLWWLAREIVRVLRQERGTEVPPPDQQAFSADPEYFENQFLTGLRSILENNTLLLTFDEFDNLEESGVKEELARPLVDHLRRLMGQPNLNFIFSIGSSGRKLENMQAAYTDFFKTALYKKISFLNEEQTHKLVTRPVEGVIEYERGAVDRIYSVTSGHPYFTQLTCHELFARCQRTEQRRIAKADVEAVLDDVVERGTVNLKFVWDEASDIEKWSLAALAQLDKTDNRALADYLRKNRVRFSETDLTSGLLHLREKDVLTPENRFVIHLLRRWLQKNRPIEQAREELTEANPIASRFIEIGLEFRDGGQYEKAIEYFRQALSVSSDNLQAQVNIALTFAAQDQLEQAVIEFEKALVMDDEDVASRSGLCEAHLKLGDIAMSRKRTQDAIQSYERILRINAEHTESRQRMAEISRQRAEKALTDGRDDEALSAFAEALKYTPEDPNLIERVEAVRTEKKARTVASLVAKSEREAKELNWDAMIRTLEEAVALLPDDSEIQKRLSNAREKRHEQKLADLKTRAQGLASAEKFGDALKTWQEYLSLDPNATEQVEEEVIRIKGNQELFDLYKTASQAIASRDFDQAIKLLKEVIYRDENYKDASRLLTKAIESRRTGTTQKIGKPRKKPAQSQPTRAQTAPKIGGKQIGIIGGLVAILALAVAGIFFGPKLWDTISPASQQAIGLTPTQQMTVVTPTLPAELASFEPVLAYIAKTQPDFEDDFSSDKWGDLAEGISTKNLLQEGSLILNLEAGTNSEKLVLRGSNIQAPQFALEFDFYFDGGTGSTILGVGFSSLGNDTNGDVTINLEERSWSIGLSDNTIKYSGEINQALVGQWAHLQVIYSDSQMAAFLNGNYLGSVDGISHLGNEIWIYAATGGQGKLRLDNIKFWNLDAFSPVIYGFTKPILDFTADTPPNFEEDFSTEQAYWSELKLNKNVTLKDAVANGALHASGNAADTSEGAIQYNFASNDLQTLDFVLQLDFTPLEFNPNTHLYVVFRQEEPNSEYWLALWQKGGWALEKRYQGVRSQIDSGTITYESGKTNTIQVLAKGSQFAILLNGKLLEYFEDDALAGNNIEFGVYSLTSLQYDIDNIKFWNLETFASSSAAAPTSTPDLRILNPANQHLYLFVIPDDFYAAGYANPTMSWERAKDYCSSLGGYLATIQDESENEFISKIISSSEIWLGASDGAEEGTWVWVSGEPWEYTNWAEGEPNTNVDNDYLLLQSYPTRKWAVGGYNNVRFVCEWESATTTLAPETQISPKDSMVMAYIPAGEFAMGSDKGSNNERPVHTVYLDSFWIDQTEVTNRMYALCVSTGACQAPKALNSYSRSSYYGNSDFENYPVIYIDWDMAKTYCTWAGQRLPTEAEWEKAARGTANYTYPWGEEVNCDKANAQGCKGETSPVGEYELGKSPYGVFDMAGNVMEWVADWYSDTYYESSPRENPLGPSSGTYHVLRGGSWKSIENSLRSSYRLGLTPNTTNFYLIGFRCALGATP